MFQEFDVRLEIESTDGAEDGSQAVVAKPLDEARSNSPAIHAVQGTIIICSATTTSRSSVLVTTLAVAKL